MIKLQTPVAETPCMTGISYGDKILLLGSCFSDSMGRTLIDYGFDALVNPFGTLYNPASIRSAIERLASGEEFTQNDCVPMGSGAGKICSFSHHTSFARETETEFLENANSLLRSASEFFRSCNKVVITLGTAWCFRYVGSDRNGNGIVGIDPSNEGKIVSNCLKRDAKEFVRERLKLDECVDILKDMVSLCENRQIIFTVSPIRHLADGAHDNQLSKSTLLMAIDEVIDNAPETEPCGNGYGDNSTAIAGNNISNGDTSKFAPDYFPAYEIMLDELRDYRFYAEDMVHPSAQAIAHITDRFLDRHLIVKDKPLLERNIREHKHSLHRMSSVAKVLLSAAIATISLLSPKNAVAQDFTITDGQNLMEETLAVTDSLPLPVRPPQNREYPRVKLAYDVDFEMNFDNKEYQSTDMYKSNTIFGARLTPSVGVEVIQNEKIRHYVMGGIDIMKDFGRGSDKDPDSGETSSRHKNADLFQEITLYYRLDYQFEKTRMNLYAGIFPIRLSKADYPESFISDSLKFYDNNYEGLLVTFDRPNSYYEVGCDWLGYYNHFDRERFMIFTYGKSQLKPWLSIGWAAYLYHYANSEVATGVCDNILINPFVDFDLAPFTTFQRLAFTLGWLQGMQRERVNGHGFVMPGGGELTFEIRKWNVGLLNRLYVGTNLQPFYNDLDSAGYKYGNEFYCGESFYRIFEDGNTSSIGVYDKIELYWEPHICDFLDLRVSLDEHLASRGINGFQQRVSLIFNLQRLLKR